MINIETGIEYIGQFPSFTRKGFKIDEYNKQFKRSNVIIHAATKGVAYPEHWGPLSIKTTVTGKEFYRSGNALYAVDPNNYLIFNEGKFYSSWIDSSEEVESFTLNFSSSFAREVLHALLANSEIQLDMPQSDRHLDLRFNEKLYRANEQVMPFMNKIRELSADVAKHTEQLNELFAKVLECMVYDRNATNREIYATQKVRLGTKVELFERLTRAKDYLYSVFNAEVTLAETADVACLNQYYFLREFKKAFHVTPHQFLTERRLEVASTMLKSSNYSISEICYAIGFSDPASFSKLFKKRFGSSPNNFRGLPT